MKGVLDPFFRILLTNFYEYVNSFSAAFSCPIKGADKPMQSCTNNKGLSIINFGMGSPSAATIMDLLIAIELEAVLFLGKCGGIKGSTEIGHFILPTAAIRGEGTSDDYFPPEVPALPAFRLQKAVSTIIRTYKKDYWSGTVYTTNRRVWEHDNDFKKYLRKLRCMAIDMETATLFTAGFYNEIPIGALLLVSDQPMISEGVKTTESDKQVSANFLKEHLS